jgi:hypothetical protein
MNIRGGLFRVWVGVSLVWACLIGLIFFSDAQQYLKPIKLTVEGTHFESPGTTSRSTVKAGLVAFLKQKFSAQMAEEDATDISQKFTSRDFPEFALQISALLVSIPAILFILGALLLWIGAGFRRLRKSSFNLAGRLSMYCTTIRTNCSLVTCGALQKGPA